MERPSIGVGIIGLGVVAGQTARVLLDKAEMLSEQVGCPLVVRKIKVLSQDMARPQASQLPVGLLTTDAEEFFIEPGIDIIVEAIGGEHHALEYLRRSLSAGKHVVTSNKEVVSKHWAELHELAYQNRVKIRFEGSVGGGIPLISPLQSDLAGNEINGIYAIINGTTNYILTRMAKEGCDFASALKTAQDLGYAEADPRNDIEGIDARYKLSILASLAFHTYVKPEEVYCEGISRLARQDFLYARELGFAIKLLAITKQNNNTIEARVHPVLVPVDSLIAKVEGVFNAILVEGDLVGKVLFYGQGAGAFPTSSAVVADVIATARDICAVGKIYTSKPFTKNRALKAMAEIETRYYLRMSIADRPGVLAQIATVLGEYKISIASAIQKETNNLTKIAEIVLMTYPAKEAAVQTAINKISKLEVVTDVSNFIRVEDI
ncbi:homoserine dehydrogenase [Chloroflexota bacterium]